MTTDRGDAEPEPAPVHHPTPDELAAEIWEDESPAPEPAPVDEPAQGDS